MISWWNQILNVWHPIVIAMFIIIFIIILHLFSPLSHGFTATKLCGYLWLMPETLGQKSKKFSRSHVVQGRQKGVFDIFFQISQNFHNQFALNFYRTYSTRISIRCTILVHIAPSTSAGHGSKVRREKNLYFFILQFSFFCIFLLVWV